MALFNTLRQILTPYANKINLHTGEIDLHTKEIERINSSIDEVGVITEDFFGSLLGEQLELGSIDISNGVYIDVIDGSSLRQTRHMPCRANRKYFFEITNNSNSAVKLAVAWYDTNGVFSKANNFGSTIPANTIGLKNTTSVNNIGFLACRLQGSGLTTDNVSVRIYTESSFINDLFLNKGTISTPGLDLNGGDFIHPGIWQVIDSVNLPKNCPTSSRTCRIISFASDSNNTIGTCQIVLDINGDKYWRFSPNTDVWTPWICETVYHKQAFSTFWTNQTPFINSYQITHHTAEETNKVSKMYALYDAAVPATGITVTKDTLGVDASNTFNIYNYKVSKNTGDKPVVLIIAGEHGDELNSAMVGYYLYKEIVDGHLTKYLKYVDFWCIPLMNPWGYENNARNNSNNVNLNRDFPCQWTYSDDTHNKTGNYSLSQAETLLIYNLLINNKDKILFMLNKHDTGPLPNKFATDQEDKVGYVATLMQTDSIVNEGITEFENQQVRETDPWLIDNALQDVSAYRLIASRNVATSGSLDVFANAIGIHGSLLEIVNSVVSSNYPGWYPSGAGHHTDLARLGLDFCVNWISATIEKNADILSSDKTTQLLKFYTRREVNGVWETVEQYWNGAELQDV